MENLNYVGLTKSCCIIDYSNVFAKDRHSFAMWVYLPESARFQTFTWLRKIPCNHRFLGGIIQTRDVMSWWSPQPFQLNSCKNFKKRVWKLVSKRQVELIEEGVIGYIVPRTSSEWHVIENAWQNTDIARKADSRMVMNWDRKSVV